LVLILENPRKVVGVFERSADSYDGWYNKPMGVYALKSELNGLERLLPVSGIGVDIGAGTGIFAEQLSTLERTIVCLDPSPKMLGKALDRGLAVVLGTVENMPLRHGVMDFAYMVTVIEFLSNPQEALESVSHVLKEDASLVLVFINRESAWGELYSKHAEKEDSIFHFSRLYKLREVCQFLHDAGYYPESIVGALTSPPDKPSDEIDLRSDTSSAGIILIKARKNNRIGNLK